VLSAPVAFAIANDPGPSPYPFAMKAMTGDAFMIPLSLLVVSPGNHRMGI
jgi:hypothetical protein